MTSAGSRDRQRGAALLLMMLAVLITASAILINRLDSGALKTRQLKNTQSSLGAARSALISYAATHPDMFVGQPMQLPCPDIDDSGPTLEGEAHTVSCGASGSNMMGRLPWRTLGIDALKDGSQQCLWYVVSGSWKGAAGATSAMINTDTNGQLRLYGLEQAAFIEGVVPQDRPIAMVLAPMQPLAGQARQSTVGPNWQCDRNFAAAAFFEADGLSGISNASLSGAANVVDDFILAASDTETLNDRIATITRSDLELAIQSRPDFLPAMRSLGLAVAKCLADYAAHNTGGPNDRRMPWPATIALADYRFDTAYDDMNGGSLSGRLADSVDDSNALTGNSIARALTDCDSSTVVEWTPAVAARWRDWKDHFFYAVAGSFAPTSAVPSVCTDCLTVNGAGQFAAIVLFANARLPAQGQSRNAPPLDPDTKDQIDNYLEGSNAANFPHAAGTADFQSQPAGSNFNDLAFCIDDILNVTEC